MKTLAPREAYRLWAPTYAAETAISALDEDLATCLSPPARGRRLLDAGCGVGRRLDRSGADFAFGIDASPDMLVMAETGKIAAADVRALPFMDGLFDLVWCRLVLGHLADPAPAYREMARVCRQGAALFVTDFHRDAAAAGHRRCFRDAEGNLHDIEHHIHDESAHAAMAAAAGFDLIARQDGLIGPSVESFYAAAGRHAAYEADRGLAVVSGFLFGRR